MKKATLIACACALFFGAQAAGAQETSYQPDPSQGLIINKMADNWFISAEAGASVYEAPFTKQRNFGDRFLPAASLYVGKWFTPVFGARIGANMVGLKGLALDKNYEGVLSGETVDGWYKTKIYQVGPVGDLLVNFSNWFCGYKADRVYSLSGYLGAGCYFAYTKGLEANETGNNFTDSHNTYMTLRSGLLNTFRLTDHWALNLDLTAEMLSPIQNEGGRNYNKKPWDYSAYVGVTYNFGNTGWNAPVVPVLPEPENCDALRARLAAADARIADLEQQLKDCLNRPVETVAADAPLATVYYPIGVSRLSRENTRVVKAIAHVMKENPAKKYVLTGWADNYTGTESINKKLRKARVNGVEKLLVKSGVAASQLTATTNDGNLSDLGEKCVALDRAVTIEEAK